MFKENRLIKKISTPLLEPSEFLELAGHFPKATSAKVQQLDSLKKESALDAITTASELVVFLDPNDPKDILNHPVFGPLVKPFESAFIQADGGKWKLDSDRLLIPVHGSGTLQKLHLTIGAGLKGSPNDDEHLLPTDWRNSVAEHVGAVVKRMAKDREKYEAHNEEDQATSTTFDPPNPQPGLAIYVDGHTITHPNGKDVITAIARAVGNLRERNDLYKGNKSKSRPNGQPKALETKSEPEPEEIVADVRRFIGEVLIVTDDGKFGQFGEAAILNAFAKGDMVSRQQILAKILAECPYQVMKAKLLAQVEVMMAAETAEKVEASGATIEIEIIAPQGVNLDSVVSKIPGTFLHDGTYRPNAKNLKVKVRTFEAIVAEGGPALNGLRAVHQGTSQKRDPGPIGVIVKFRHPESKGQPVRTKTHKGVVLDTGGIDIKKELIDEMRGDMGAAAHGITEIGRIGEEIPKANIDLVFGNVSNHIGPESYVPGEIIECGGKTLMVLNTDAEGRIVLIDMMRYELWTLHRDGEKAAFADSEATLTGAALRDEAGTTPIVSKSVATLETLRQYANKHGEAVTPKQRRKIDATAVEKNSGAANVSNLTGLPLRGRGVSTGAEVVAQGAELEGDLDRNSVHWDVAGTSLTRWSGVTPKDVAEGDFPMELPYDTSWHRLTG